MPSPGRRNTPPPPHIGSGSSSYRRQRSPDRQRKMEPTSRSAGSSRNVSPPLRSRRPPEHTSRPPPESRSRPSLSRPSVLPPRRNRSPSGTDTNGRSFSAAHSVKRKASPKREREVVREHLPSRPTPRKMMRSVSPVRPPPPRDIPLLAPARPSPPPLSRSYAHHSPPPARGYAPKPPLPPASRGYTDVSVTLVSDTRSYSSTAAGVGKPATSSRQYVSSSSAMVRRSPSEGRAFGARPSAQKRATAHMTSNRFSDMHVDDEDLLTRRSESINLKPGLSDFVFNVSNEPQAKFSRDGHGVVRTITNPESLQVVRRPAPQSRDAPMYNKNNKNHNNSNGYDSEDEDLYRPRPKWTDPREGARPIFDRDEIKRPSRDDDLLDRPPVQQVARFVSSGPYLDVSRDSRNGQPPSRPVASHSRDTHARDIPSHSRDIPSSHSRDIPSSHSRDIPSRSRDVREAPSHRSSSRPGPARDSYYEHEERREYSSRGFEEEEEHRGRHDNGSHRSARRDDRDDLRHELELRRDPAAHHSPERGARGRDPRGESDSDLRVRINEKRSTRSTDRVFRERADERGGRPHEHGSRPHERERRRSASGERRRDPYERKPPAGGGRSAQQGSYRDRTPPPPAASGSRYHHEEREEYHEQPMIPWVPDPEHVPRGNAYFEHDNREEGMVMVRGRGGYMHMRGFVGRGMRRPYRGSPMNRGGYVMLGRGPRRGFGPPRGFIAFRPLRPYAGFPVRRPFAPNLRRPSATLVPRRPSGPAVVRPPVVKPPTPVVPVVPTPTSQS